MEKDYIYVKVCGIETFPFKQVPYNSRVFVAVNSYGRTNMRNHLKSKHIITDLLESNEMPTHSIGIVEFLGYSNSDMLFKVERDRVQKRGVEDYFSDLDGEFYVVGEDVMVKEDLSTKNAKNKKVFNDNVVEYPFTMEVDISMFEAVNSPVNKLIKKYNEMSTDERNAPFLIDTDNLWNRAKS